MFEWELRIGVKADERNYISRSSATNQLLAIPSLIFQWLMVGGCFVGLAWLRQLVKTDASI